MFSDYDIQHHIARLTSGSFTFKVDGRRYVSKPPSALAVMISREVRKEVEEAAQEHGLKTRAEHLAWLNSKKLWTGQDEEELVKHREWIEDLLVTLYTERDDKDKTLQNRNVLNIKRQTLHAFEVRRSYCDDTTVEYLVQQAHQSFLCGCSLHEYNGTPYWRDPDRDRFRPDTIVEIAQRKIAEDMLSISKIRKLARHPQWLSIWDVKNNAKGLVDEPACRLTDEFTSLLRWTSNYINVQSLEDPPSQDVTEDDDLFDGWRIWRNRQIEANKELEKTMSFKSELGKPGGECFLMVNTENRQKVARIIENGMDDVAKLCKEKRLGYLKSDEAKEMAQYFPGGSIPEKVFPSEARKAGLEDRDKLMEIIKKNHEERLKGNG